MSIEFKKERELTNTMTDLFESGNDIISKTDIKPVIDEEKDQLKDTISAISEKDLNDELSQPTKTHNEQRGETVEDIRKNIKDYEDKNTIATTPEMVEQSSSFIINAFDFIMSRFLSFMAKDSSSTAYSRDIKDKEQLSKQLSMILIKNKTPIKIEYVFIMTLLLMYAPAIVSVINIRREAKNKKAINSAILKDTETIINNIKNNPESRVDINNAPVMASIKQDQPIKRKRGAPRKIK